VNGIEWSGPHQHGDVSLGNRYGSFILWLELSSSNVQVLGLLLTHCAVKHGPDKLLTHTCAFVTRQ